MVSVTTSTATLYDGSWFVVSWTSSAYHNTWDWISVQVRCVCCCFVVQFEPRPHSHSIVAVRARVRTQNANCVGDEGTCRYASDYLASGNFAHFGRALRLRLLHRC